jgi:hypothetical protein
MGASSDISSSLQTIEQATFEDLIKTGGFALCRASQPAAMLNRTFHDFAKCRAALHISIPIPHIGGRKRAPDEQNRKIRRRVA